MRWEPGGGCAAPNLKPGLFILYSAAPPGSAQADAALKANKHLFPHQSKYHSPSKKDIHASLVELWSRRPPWKKPRQRFLSLPL